MRAMVFDGSGTQLELRDVPTPTPTEGRVRKIAIDDVQVRPTDAAGFDADTDLALGWGGRRYIP